MPDGILRSESPTEYFRDLVESAMQHQHVAVRELTCFYVVNLLAGFVLLGTEALYGRNWGCRGDYPFLHFEACYYQAIDFAIAHGLARVEAGAHGEHKIQRGYLPVPTYSAHWIKDADFRAAIADFLRRETPAIRQQRDALAELSPFRNETDAATPSAPQHS